MPLFVVPTPIGNLADITLRALSVLRESHLILCEDTRVSRILLMAHDVVKPTLSYHKFNERSRLKSILERLHEGEQLALISSAGTPGICDPGQRLIEACHVEAIEVWVLPGACSAITALVASGFCDPPFQMVGFLDRKARGQLRQMLAYQGTSICFLSPHKLTQTLQALSELETQLGDAPRSLALVKELTKKFEAQFRGSAQQVLAALAATSQAIKGEWILVLSAPTGGKVRKAPPSIDEVRAEWEVGRRQGLSTKQIICVLSERFSLKRQELYQLLNAGDALD